MKNEEFKIKNGVLINCISTSENIIIPNNVTNIGGFAFWTIF